MKGRKRKPNVIRSQTGKSRGEPVADIKAVVWEQRIKAGIPEHEKDNALAGFTLGVLRMYGLRAEKTEREDHRGISALQLDTGERWANLCRWHSAVVCSSPRLPSASIFDAAKGKSLSPDPDDRAILARRHLWGDCYNALQSAARDHGGWRLIEVVYGVCVENWPHDRLREEDYVMLRIGLNALGRML